MNSAKSTIVIAIDGPSASGKSTTSRAVAEALQYNYVDTGAMYRSFAWRCLQAGIEAGDRAAVVALLEKTDLQVAFEEGRSQVSVDGVQPGDAIRTEAVNSLVSAIAAVPEVRARMVELQRSLRGQGDLVMEGRDIGTVVFPDAPYKFFLDASPEERVRRRAKEMNAAQDRIAETLQKRDTHDSTRTVSPLKAASDAIRIDTDGKSVAAVADIILKHIRTKHFANPK